MAGFRFELSIADARKLVTVVKATVPRKGGSLPIMRCMRITVDRVGGPMFDATNLESQVRIDAVGAGVTAFIGEGCAVIDVDDFTSALKGGKGTAAVVQAEDGTVTVATDTTVVRVPTAAAADYPRDITRAGAVAHVGKWDAAEWWQAFDAAAPVALAADTSRLILASLAFDTERGALVATDSYRLVVADLPMEPREGREGDIPLLPRSAVAVLGKVRRRGGVVTVTVTGDSNAHETFTVEGDGWTVTARATVGEFPNYRGLLPSTDTRLWCFEATTEAWQAAAKAAPKGCNCVVVNAEGDAGDATLSTPDGSWSARVVGGWADLAGRGVRLGVNPGFLAACAAAYPAGTVVCFHGQDIGGEHGVQKPIVSDHRGILTLLMPVRM